jgi:catechol 2,3-dioxygenase-like lactoylglutathione lyase family enzyme
MDGKVFGSRTVAQVGIVVKDIERTAEAYARAFGIEKPGWAWTGALDAARTEHRGSPSPARAKLAFMRFGQLDIELIEPDEHPSTWREFLDEKGEGIHHLAFVVEGMKEHVARAREAGMILLQKGEYEGGRYAYLDAQAGLKTVVELLENDAKKD